MTGLHLLTGKGPFAARTIKEMLIIDGLEVIWSTQIWIKDSKFAGTNEDFSAILSVLSVFLSSFSFLNLSFP